MGLGGRSGPLIRVSPRFSRAESSAGTELGSSGRRCEGPVRLGAGRTSQGCPERIRGQSVRWADTQSGRRFSSRRKSPMSRINTNVQSLIAQRVLGHRHRDDL